MRTKPAYVVSCPLFASAVEAFLHFLIIIYYSSLMHRHVLKKRRQRELVCCSSYCCDRSVGQVTAYGRTEFDSSQRLGFFSYRRYSDRLLFPLSPILNELL
jgi:hypothetical protein